MCPLLHFVSDYEKVIKTFDFYNEQERRSFPRRIKQNKLVNCRVFLKQTLLAAEDIQRMLKLEKENLRMAKLKRRQHGLFTIQYDTMYLGSEMSLATSSESEELEQSQLHDESQGSEKEIILAKGSIENIITEEKYGYNSTVKTMSLQSNVFEKELVPKIDKIEDDRRRSSVQVLDLGSSASIHPSSMPPILPPHSITPSSLLLPLSLLPPTSTNSPPPPSFSSHHINLKKNNNFLSSTSLHGRVKTEGKVRKEEWRRDEGIVGRREEGGRREEESGIVKRNGKGKDMDRYLSIGSKMGTKIATGIIEGIQSIIEMDRASIFKNYFPESNVNSVLEVYEKKRKLLAFLHEAKQQTILENTTVNKNECVMLPLLTTHYLTLADGVVPAETNEQIRRRVSKYTFYVSRMFDIISQKKKKSREERTHKKEDNGGNHRLVRNMKRKANFFENEGEKKKLSDFILEIMKHPKYETWKKRTTIERKSLTIFQKKVKRVKGLLSCFKFY